MWIKKVILLFLCLSVVGLLPSRGECKENPASEIELIGEVIKKSDLLELSIVEGTLIQVSSLPSAAGSDYPDCYFTATLDLEHIISGRPIPKRIVIVLPGFFSRQYVPESKFKVGDKIHATVVPFDSMPDTVKQTQQADQVEDFDLEYYSPEKVELIQEYQKVGTPVPFAGASNKDLEKIVFTPIDEAARSVRQETIRKDLDQINILLAEHGGDWDKWYGSLSEFRTQYSHQNKAKAQKWIGDSFFSAGPLPDDKIYSPEFIQSIIAFNDYLAQRNVDLILVRIPSKGEVVADLFAPLPPDQIQNPYLLRMYKQLLDADVEIRGGPHP